MKKFNFNNISNAVFLALILAAMLVCLVRTAVFPMKINAAENRYANVIMPLTAQSYGDGSFQDSVENALADQAPAAPEAKRVYNFASIGIRNLFLSSVFTTGEGRYIRLGGGLSLFGNSYLVYDPRVLENMKPDLDKKIANLNSFSASHPEVPIYVYYIEKETDINFETGEKAGVFEYLTENLDIPSENMAAFRIDSFEDYSPNFYHTDHHWNWRGSYKGYLEVQRLLGGSVPIEPIEEITLRQRLVGSKAIEVGGADIFSEEFTAYHFNYPSMTITMNGMVGDYGNQDKYFLDYSGDVSYGDFYGTDYGEVIFDTHDYDKENILVIGESHDNAILKLIAGDFNCTYAIDLRNYEAHMGQTFNAYDYIAGHDIDKVLLIGSIGYFTADTFNLTD